MMNTRKPAKGRRQSGYFIHRHAPEKSLPAGHRESFFNHSISGLLPLPHG